MAHRGRGAGAASGGLRRAVLVSRGGETREGRAPYLINTSGLRVATKRRLRGVDYMDSEERRLVAIFLKAVDGGEANAVYAIAKQLFEY